MRRRRRSRIRNSSLGTVKSGPVGNTVRRQLAPGLHWESSRCRVEVHLERALLHCAAFLHASSSHSAAYSACRVLGGIAAEFKRSLRSNRDDTPPEHPRGRCGGRERRRKRRKEAASASKRPPTWRSGKSACACAGQQHAQQRPAGVQCQGAVFRPRKRG